MFKVQIRQINLPDEQLIADVVNVASRLDKPSITEVEYLQFGRFSTKLFRKRFGSWLNALERAGLSKTVNRNISDDELFENLSQVWTSNGRQPTYNNLIKSNSKYSVKPYTHRFGSWNNALVAFEAWANEGIKSIQNEKNEGKVLARTARDISWRLRARILMRDGATCQMCGATPQTGAKLHVDHVLPWSKGGETVIENLRILCVQCNLGKGDLMPELGD
jgi:hypothetical protein